MKERRPFDNDEPVKRDVSSEDIPNAHAAGDGAMGRNDEKLPNGDGEEKTGEEQPRPGTDVY